MVLFDVHWKCTALATMLQQCYTMLHNVTPCYTMLHNVTQYLHHNCILYSYNVKNRTMGSWGTKFEFMLFLPVLFQSIFFKHISHLVETDWVSWIECPFCLLSISYNYWEINCDATFLLPHLVLVIVYSIVILSTYRGYEYRGIIYNKNCKLSYLTKSLNVNNTQNCKYSNAP